MKLFLLLFLTFFASLANAAGNVTVNWIFDTSATATCDDGLPAATNCALTGFEMSEQVNGVWAPKTPNLSATARSQTYSNLPAGRRCYRLRAISANSISLFSTEECVTIPASSPKSPTITVTVTVSVNPTPP